MTDLFNQPIEETTAAVTWQAFQAEWNTHLNLPRILLMNAERREKLKARLKNEQFRLHWKHMIKAMNTDTQYHGNAGWQKCLVDFFLRNDMNWVRVLETHPPGEVVQAKRNKWDIAAEQGAK